MKDHKKFDFSSIFGSYTAPSWIKSIGYFFTGKTPGIRKARKIVYITLGGIAGTIILAFCTLLLIGFILSKRPVKMRIDFDARTPAIERNSVSPLTLNFYGSAAKVTEVGKEVSENIIIKPAIAGVWRWTNESTLTFVPSVPWQLGTHYTVTMPKNLFPEHVQIKSYTTSFSTEDFEASIENEEFYIDPSDASIKRVLFEIHANFPVETDGVPDLISITPDMRAPKNGTFVKRPYTFTVSWSDDKKTLFAASEPVGVPAKDVDMDIKVDTGLKSSYGGSVLQAMKSSVLIPGSGNYARINSTDFSLVKNDEEEYEQIIAVSTTAKISGTNLASKMEIYELPEDRPKEPGHRAYADYYWRSTDEITKTVLSKAKKISPLTPQPTELEYETLQTYKIDVTPGKYLYIKISEGTKFYGDYYLAEDYENIVRVGSYPREVHILSEGTILSMKGSHEIPMYTRGINHVNFTVWRMKPTEINHIVSMSNGDMKNFSFKYYNFNQDNVSQKYTSSKTYNNADPRLPRYISYDFSKLLGTDSVNGLKSGLFLFKVSDENGNSDQRLIIVSDFGMFVKKGTNGTNDIFIQSIAGGGPVGGATVSIISLNGNVLVSGTTGGDGRVSFPQLANTDRSLRPVAFTVQKGNDFTFMPYRDSGRLLDYSDFNVGGEYGRADPDALHAYIFSDRGIYRPGDEARLGLIIKAGNWTKNIARTPVEYVVTDPNGTEIADREISLSDSGFDEIRFSTKDYSPTGEYDVSVYLLTKNNNQTKRTFLGKQTVNVEEFLPDTLSISASFNPLPAEGWIKPDKLSGIVTLRNLFGTPAAGNTIKAQIQLDPGYPYFAKYRDYRFSDPLTNRNSYTERLDEKETDDDGRAEYEFDMKKFEKASYLLRFYTEGFEKGSGRNVSAESTVYVSPLDYLIGVKTDGDLSYIKKDMKRTLTFIAVGPDLKQTAVNDVKMRIFENRYVSVLVKQPNGVYKYQSVKKEYPVSDQTISIPAEGLKFALPITAEGDFVLTLENKDGLQFNKISYSVIGEKNVERSLTRTAELEVKTEKSDFQNGETIQLFIKAPYAGSGLIAIERDKVYTYKWFRSDGPSSVQTITVPQGLEGNGYVTIMYARAYDSPEIYMSPFCYAAVPFSISLEKRTNKITLDVPAETKPGTDYTISYSSAKPGKIVLMAVDEGILQVAHYTMPNPLADFFKKRALEVSTAQLLDLILPEFKVLQSVTATGGGADYEALSRNLNPFKRKRNKPVAYWSGIIDTDSQKRTVTYHIPDYFNGKIRVMAVAVSPETIGVARSSTEVKDTFIIMPNVPTFAAPGDEFDVSVTVTNNEKGSGASSPVTLTAKPSKQISVVSGGSVKLTIPEGKDATTTFRLKANDSLGGAEILFTASSAAQSSRITSTLSVRPPVPYQVWLSSGVVRKDKETLDVHKKMYEEFATRKVSLSYLPMGLAKGLLFYLEKYPYGCSEQVTSAAFPYLFPGLLKESGKTKADAKEAVANVVSILESRQKQDGSIGYWTYRSPNYQDLDAYCALFLTEARDKGYYVPAGLMNRLLYALRNTASSRGTSDYKLFVKAFSIYVLTRNEIVTTNYIENLRSGFKQNPDAEKSLAGMYLAASYKLLQQDKEGNAVLAKVRRGMRIQSGGDYRFEDSLYAASLYLNVVSLYYPERLKDVSVELLDFIEKELAGQQYTTFSSAAALAGIESYLAAVPTASTGNYTITETAGKNKTPLTASGDTVFTATFSDTAEKLLLVNKEKTNLFYQMTQAGFLHDIPAAETKNGIEIYREYENEDGKQITTAKVGDNVTVKIRFRTIDPKRKTVDNIAIVDLLPAGLEADRESIRIQNTGYEPDYVDIREDRLVLFGSAVDELQTFTYHARAVNTGTFIVPPLFAEAMYDKTITAIRPQKPITIMPQ